MSKEKIDSTVVGIIGNGRIDLLERTIDSFRKSFKNFPFYKKVIVDDTGDLNYANYLEQEFGDEFHIVAHLANQGLSGSVRTLWSLALLSDTDNLFHIEEDFTFNEGFEWEDILSSMVQAVREENVAQIALKRQPCNPQEAEAGGFMQLAPDTYSTRKFYIEAKTGTKDFNCLMHRNFFTLNPCVYPRWLMQLGWEKGWGEKEFGELLFSNPKIECGYVGMSIDEPSMITHIGNYRGSNWFV